MARTSDHSFVVQPHCLFNTEFPIGLQMEEEFGRLPLRGTVAGGPTDLSRSASQPNALIVYRGAGR